MRRRDLHGHQLPGAWEGTQTCHGNDSNQNKILRRRSSHGSANLIVHEQRSRGGPADERRESQQEDRIEKPGHERGGNRSEPSDGAKALLGVAGTEELSQPALRDAEEGKRQQRDSRNASLYQPSHPITAWPRVGGHSGLRLVHRGIVARSVRGILHRPVPRPHAEQRMTYRDQERLSVLNESPVAATALIIGDAFHRLEVGIAATPVKRVRDRQRGGPAQDRDSGGTRGPPPRFPGPAGGRR